jgi:hypothetical protein
MGRSCSELKLGFTIVHCFGRCDRTLDFEWLRRTATNRLILELFSTQAKRDNARLACVPVGCFRPDLGQPLMLTERSQKTTSDDAHLSALESVDR